MNALYAMLAKILLSFCALLPLRVARALGRGAVLVYWPFGGRSRQVTQKNIQLAFPELDAKGQRRLARQSLVSTGELIGEMGHIWLRPWSQVQKLILEVHGQSLICDAQAEGRGVIVLAPHLGNWEVLGLHLATLGGTVSLYEPPKIAQLGALIEQSRQRSGATLVPTTARGLAKLVKSVRGGDISGILPDQVPSDINSGQNSPFMGISCFTPTLASNMIRRTGALAVFGFAQRVTGGFVLHYSLADENIYSEDTSVSLATLNEGVETCLRHCVDQYQWEYKRFRERPRVAPGHYKDL